MTEFEVPPRKELETKKTDPLTVAILLGLIIVATFGIIVSLANAELGKVFLPGGTEYVPGGVAYEIIYVLLSLATNVLYVLGAGVIAFAAALFFFFFIQCKIKDPDQPSCVSHQLSGYLTLSLEIFIGAEILKSVVVRTLDELLVLILVMLSRGLFSLILYLERRWHGTADTE